MDYLPPASEGLGAGGGECGSASVPLAALQIPAKGIVVKCCFCTMCDPAQLAGLKTDSSSHMLIRGNAIRVISYLYSQELGAFDPLYF